MNERTELVWAIVVVVVITSIFVMVMYGLSHPFVVRYEMDGNTLEAIKSINWSALEGVRK